MRRAALYALLGAIFLGVAAFFALVLGVAVVTALLIAIIATAIMLLFKSALGRFRAQRHDNAKSE